MQYFPSSPLAREADVERRERSWVLNAGSRQFSLTRIEYRAVTAEHHYVVHRRRSGPRPSRMIGAMLGVLGGLTLLGVAITSSRASAGYRYVVSVPVPPVRSAYRTAPAATVAPAPRRARPSAGKAAPARAAVIDPQIVDYSADATDMATEPAAANTLSAAMRAAMTTGRLQQWATMDGSERGFIVVGPAEGGAGGCRAVSILTRRDGDNHVERRRECSGGGADDASR